jgi:hypothetical protein
MNNSQKIIDNLSPDDALVILQRLAAQDEKLAAEIASLALAYLSNLDAEEITGALREDLEGLTPEEVWDGAGNTRYGYVETGEAAEQMIEAVLTPYLEEMRKYHKTGLAWEAQQVCKGLLLGFYAFEYQSKTEFKDWAIDAPLAFAEEVLTVWREGVMEAQEQQEMQAFITEQLPKWVRTLLARKW